MRILKIEKENIGNGPGIRTIIWIAGCDNYCENCHSKWTWSHEQGTPLNSDIINEIIDITDKGFIQGITFSGGDPLSKLNCNDTLDLLKILKEKLPEKNFWCWTGKKFEDLKNIPGIENFDIIVDGKFEYEKKDITLAFRGSSNQRVIDVKKSLQNNSVVLYDPR